MKKVINLIKHNRLVALLLLLFILGQIYLISKTFTLDTEGNMRAAIAGYGDIPFHLTQVSKFAFGDLFNFEEPLYAGEKIRYAFGINYLSGIILGLTNSWSVAVHLPTMLFAGVTALIIYFTYLAVLKNHLASFLSLLLFYLGSGMGAWRYINEQIIKGSLSIKEFLNYLVDKNISTISRWDAVYPQQNIDWGAPLSLVLLHQRAFFFGILLFTAVIYILVKFRNYDNKYAVILAGVLFGLTPLTHYHTFLAIGLVLGALLLEALWKKNPKLIKKYGAIILIAIVVALPQLLYLMNGGQDYTTESFIKIRLGWMTEPTIGSYKYPPEASMATRFLAYINFLWVNFGLVLPLFVLASVLVVRSKQVKGVFKNINYFAWGGVLFFVFTQLVRVQPWDYDNNKLLVYFQFFAAPVIIVLLLWIMAKKRALGKIIFAAAFILMVFSGVVDNIPRAMVPQDRMPVIFNRDAIRMAHFIRTNVEPHDLILTSSTHLNVVSSLAGRSVLVGYPGWLWTKGINYGKREGDLRRFFGDPITNRDVVGLYEARYALLDPSVVYDWKADKSIFDKNFVGVFSSGDFTLYRVK